METQVVSATMEMLMDNNTVEVIVSMVIDMQDRESTSLPLYDQ